MGTNNSNADISSSGGAQWETNVYDVETFLVDNGFSNPNNADAIYALGGNDIEPLYYDYSDTNDWVTGFDTGWGTVGYVDYGSADGCPTDTSDYNNASCDNSWTQDDLLNISYGNGVGQALPEIYNSNFAAQWQLISQDGKENHSGAISFLGPLDEYNLDNTTYTSTDAWDTFWTDLNNQTDTAQNLSVSAEIDREPTPTP